MKPRRPIILIMLIGLVLFAFAAVMAQTPAQGQDDQKKPAEACCAMESCCSGDSCEMKDKGDMKDHKDACCAESCDMSKHDAKHDKKDHKDCCKMKQKDKKKAA